MSDTETHIGRLKIHEPFYINGEKATLEQQCQYILEQKLKENSNINFDITNYDSWEEALLDGPFYKTFSICNNKILEIIEDTIVDSMDLFSAQKQEDNIYSYVVQYYNGGCSLTEAINYAMRDKEDTITT